MPVTKDAMPPIAAFPKSKPLPIPLDIADFVLLIILLSGLPLDKIKLSMVL